MTGSGNDNFGNLRIFTPPGGSYGTLINDIGGAYGLWINGSGTFADIQSTVMPATIKFDGNTTQTFTNFTLSGTVGKPITLYGGNSTFTRPSGATNVNYLNIQDSHVTGGDGWYANRTSTDLGNNTGWNFTPTIYPSTFFLSLKGI